jgi:uncharacterized ion transporter superfamily protein YfcC
MIHQQHLMLIDMAALRHIDAPQYWASLFSVLATALVGSLLIPASIGWFKSKRQTDRLNSLHLDIDKGNTEQLNTSYYKIIDTYSEGKINNEQYTNLKSEISIHFEEIYRKRIDSSNGNEMLLDKVKDEIKDAYVKGKLNEQHFANLKSEILLSIFVRESTFVVYTLL